MLTAFFMHLQTKGATWGSASYPTVGCGGVGYLQKALERTQLLSGLSPCKMTVSYDGLSRATATIRNLSFPPRKSRHCIQDSSHSPAS